MTGKADGVLLEPGPLVVVNRLDDPPIPLFLPAFIDHFVEDIVEIVHRVDDFTNVGGLQCINFALSHRMNLQIESISIGVAVDAIDVVAWMKRMVAPGPGFGRSAPAVAVI